MEKSFQSIEEEYRYVYDLALRLLTRRAHGEAELIAKLRLRHNSMAAIEPALQRCRELNYLNDARFAEDRLRSRLTNRGWGPIRARLELRSLGICPETIDIAMEQVMAEVDLVTLAAGVLERRFSPAPRPLSLKERKRRQAFLFRRGFDHETIACVV
ncbi:MAG: regulatory protein RecX [Magnetococcales bacterium]|nr:regulatory protein RecX [Magnetococcales bacterium]